MSNNEPGEFSDAALKDAIAREATAIDVDPVLRAGLGTLFAENTPPPSSGIRPHLAARSYRNSFLLAAAAAAIVLSAGFFALMPHEQGEYTIAETRLWPAIASLYPAQAISPNDGYQSPVVIRLAEGGYRLVGTRPGQIESIDCTVSDFVQNDGKAFSVVVTRADQLIRDSSEEVGERYDEKVKSIRIVGEVKEDYWICVVSSADAPASLFNDALSQVVVQPR